MKGMKGMKVFAGALRAPAKNLFMPFMPFMPFMVR